MLILLTTAAFVLAPNFIEREFIAWGPIALTVYIDIVSLSMLVLVGLLVVTVAVFSQNYLRGNEEEGFFLKWLSITGGSVLLLLISGNLALFALAWVAISLSLHHLLTFYKERHGAKFAGRKKFILSRCADMMLGLALVIIWHEFGTLDIQKLITTIPASSVVPCFDQIAFLLVIAAAIKSVQFPFHGWLPETMETPTPVSALMHAGIINAGGFLMIRLSPLIILSSPALKLLAIIGAITALFGSLVLTTQTSIKRSLAFSTIAQMGFMMLECGLGAFGIALLHIVTHSLYKAHAFLSSGTMTDERVLAAFTADQQEESSRLHFTKLLAAFFTAFGLVLLVTLIAGLQPWLHAGEFCLLFILFIAITQLLFHWWSMTLTLLSRFIGLLLGLLLAALFFLLHEGIQLFVGSSLPPLGSFTVGWPIVMATVAGFFVLALRLFLLPKLSSTKMGHALFVHTYNGFYIHTIGNRLIALLLPSSCFKK
ncbi:MAG: proton-conducting transporter membrane subunit [Chthoniobacterales bacterium]